MDNLCKLDIYDNVNDRIFTKTFKSEFEKDKFKRKLRYSNKLSVAYDYSNEYWIN